MLLVVIVTRKKVTGFTRLRNTGITMPPASEDASKYAVIIGSLRSSEP